MNLKDLTKPFPANEIEWRIQSSGIKKDGSPWAKVLAYVSARAIMNRLDEVCGPEHWNNEIKQITIKITEEGALKEVYGFLHGISIFTDKGFVTKWDGAECTDFESLKGGISGSIKRAAVLWGIGRYLYDLKHDWAVFEPEGTHNDKINSQWYRWSPPQLPAWALPEGTAILQVPCAPSKNKESLEFYGDILKEDTQVSVDGFKEAQKASVKVIPTQPSTGLTGWRAVLFPVGDFKDKPIGSMPEKDLAYWCKKFTATEWKGKDGKMHPPTKKAIAAREALDAALEEMKKKEITAPQDSDTEDVFSHEEVAQPPAKDIIGMIQHKLVALDRGEEWLIRELHSMKKITTTDAHLHDLTDDLLTKINDNWHLFVKKSESLPI